MDWIYPLIFFIVVLGVVLLLKHFSEKSGGKEKDHPLPYKAKPYLFSRSEHELLRILHGAVDGARYMIFPKVRLADFIEVDAPKQEFRTWWNKIKSKHVDFLIWDMKENKIALAIELDGSSHDSERMKVRDAFVNKLYTRIDVRLEHIAVGSDFHTHTRRINEILGEM